ncbi:hypothetical protein HUU05_20570 [candidate division KSB1 bacterium]|nr:hypothetical protein [candidate division KSB1 bacterium]
MAKQRSSIVPGIVLILIGLYFLANRLDWPIPDFFEIYPFVFLLLAIACAARIRGWGNRDGVFGTFFFLTLGVFFILRNYDLIPYIYHPWPIWLIAAGIGCIAVFVFAPSQWGMLIPGSAFLLFGGAFLLREFDIIYNVDRYWPIIVIAIGVGILLKGLRKQV